ncbi:Serine/threonine-protein kinase [Saxophila tyrrhenica]|uniref:non-specific serine/threonine protein kinase n=1 Tax=Saxophila tyrrhenica TaxID=1690608 RepID=A0AAV9PCM3_9PEZI|nr:Serine/threonine-protein kinase [Saxophila tyrrhenica]
MASADFLRPYSKQHDDELHDQIGSGASTPPGAATPRPDFVDKRLPGIINSYFGQVRDSLLKRSKSTSNSPNNPAPSSEQEKEPIEQKEPEDTSSQHMASDANRERDGASTSPLSANSGAHESPPLLPHEPKRPGPQHLQTDYPTPPLSNSSSFIAMNHSGAGGNGGQRTPSPRKRSWTQRKESIAALTSSLRRATLSDETTTAVTQPDVSAQLSNPCTASEAPTDASSSLCQNAQDSDARVLTNGAERPQNTPPQTPRTQSYSHDHKPRDDTSNVRSVPKSSRSSSGGSQAATIGQLKGQLEICIEEGRGLRPSVEPYVVCVFQQNEDISGGPKEDAMDTRENGAGEEKENLAKGVAMKRLGSGSGTPISIPGLRSRQTSSTNIAALRRGSDRPERNETTEPQWRHTATFDVVGEKNEVDISVYDKSNNETFIGHVRLPLNLDDYQHQHEDWFNLEAREASSDHVTGQIRLKIAFHASGKKVFGPDDFQILKLIGKGTFGQVFQVRKKDTKRIYAMKVLSKKVIVQKKEIQHTIGERNILVRTATSESPFIVGLKFSFQTAADLYLVTDYMSGGELFWHLQKEGRFHEERAKFYIAELILALRHLHQYDIVYRDLKPENILLDANGHIALCDFGLSKANLAKNDTTNTFCGTTEYLAPEVLLDEQGYTKMVDFWSLGVLVFEMCCGWSPFYAEDTQQMYKNIAFGKVRFPRDALSQEGRNFVKGLLNRNPQHRLGAKQDAEELMGHPFFHDVDWNALSKKLTQPPFKPKLKGELDTSNFDPEFTNALTDGGASSLNARAAALASGVHADSTPLSPTMQNQFKGFTFVDESTLEQQFGDRDFGMDGTDDRNANRVSTNFSGRDGGDRMSGIEPSSAQSDSEFNHGMLDDI